jgi:antitoxin HicB
MKMKNPDRYPAEVFWSDEDEGFIATAPDLPGCSAFGETQAEALAELDQAIVAWKQAAQAAGNPVPAPSKPAESEYSGKFLLRMAKSMHAQLAVQAHREGVSLNQYVVTLLATFGSLRAVQGAYEAVHVSAMRSFETHSGTATRGGSWSSHFNQTLVQERITLESVEKLTTGTDIVVPYTSHRPRLLPFSPIYVEEAPHG